MRNDIGLNNPHFGCGLAQCGACTVHLNGQAIRSCVTPVSAVGNGKVVTLAGLGTPEKPHPLQTAYVEEQVTQCGYCINGWIMTAAAFLRDKKKPTDAEIKKRARRAQVPLRHAHEHPARRQARRRDDGLRETTMTKMEKPDALLPPLAAQEPAARWWSRSACRSAPTPCSASTGARAGDGTKPPLMPDQLSSYIAINADGTVIGLLRQDGHGPGPVRRHRPDRRRRARRPVQGASRCSWADTRTSVNQGGASGSTGIQLGGKQMRAASAEARRVLVEMAAQKLNLPADQLTVTDGVVHAKSDPKQEITYAELIGGRYFNVAARVEQADRQRALRARQGQPKNYKEHKIVGKPIPRDDVAPMVFCQEAFVTDVKRPGMVHAPHDPPAGRRRAMPVKVDEASIKDIPGARVVRENNFLASSPTTNGTRSRPAEQLKVEWSDVKPPFLDQPTRSTTTSARRRSRKRESTASRSAMSMRRSRPPRA